MMTYQEKLTVHLINCATGVSKPRIRAVLDIAEEIEQAKRIRNIMSRQSKGRTALASVEHRDGGCIVYRPAVWCSEGRPS